MNLEEKVKHLRDLAAPAKGESRRNADDASRLQMAADRPQDEANEDWAKAEELARQADSLLQKPAVRNVDVLLPEMLKVIQKGRKRLRKAITKGKRVAKLVPKLQDRKERLKFVLESSLVSVEMRKECLQELSEVVATLAAAKSKLALNTRKGHAWKLSTQPEMQAHTDGDVGADANTDIDELQILEETYNLRALPEMNAENDNNAPAWAEPQDSARTMSVELGVLAEQQVLAELQASTIPTHPQREPEQQAQLENANVLFKRVQQRTRGFGEYQPTKQDKALGAKWTLLSAYAVRHDLDREIREGGHNPYIAGHVAIMQRKLAILRLFKDGLDAPPGAILDEFKALNEAISRTGPMIKMEKLQVAKEMLYNTDSKNNLHQTLHCAEQDRSNIPNVRKRQHVEDRTSAEDSGSEDGHTAKHRRTRYRGSHKTMNMYALSDHDPQASKQHAIAERPDDVGLLCSRHVGGSADTKSVEDQYDSTDFELLEGLP